MAFPIGWQRVCPLVVQYSKCASNTLPKFPVVLTAPCLPAEMVTTGAAYAAQANGGDIRFSLDPAGLQQLPCEVRWWTQNATAANAVAEIWVTLDLVFAATDVNENFVFYVWYKGPAGSVQPAANAAFGSQAVWPAEYRCVQHALMDGGIDSTQYGCTASSVFSVATGVGKIGPSCGSFDKTVPSFLVLPTGGGTVGTSNAITKTLTTSLWFKGVGTQGSYPTPFARCESAGTNGWNLGFQTANAGFVIKETGQAWGNTNATGASGAMTDNAWHYFVGVYSGSSAHVYIDGKRLGTASATGAAVDYGSAPGFTIGQKPSNPFNGLLEEVRLVAIDRNPGWILTEYNNQNSPDTFVLPGTPYSPGAFAATTSYYGSDTVGSGGGSVTSGGSSLTIQDEGIALTQRPSLNFVGTGVTASDDSANNATVVTIPGGGSGSQTPWTQDIDAAGYKLQTIASSNKDLAFATNGTERMRILSGGSIGIGTSSTQAQSSLQVYNTASLTDITIGQAGGGILDLMAITSGGTGWYTALGANLYYTGAAWNLRNTAQDAWMFYINAGAGSGVGLYHSPSGSVAATLTNFLQVDTTGKVGIGKTPSYLLDVNGDVNSGGIHRTGGLPISQITSQSANLAGAGRALSTVYTNSTGKPMHVTVTVNCNASMGISVYADSGSATTVIAQCTTGSAGATYQTLSFWVMPGFAYKAVTGGGTLTQWFEYS